MIEERSPTRITVGDVRRGWRNGYRTTATLARHLGWQYPDELLDGLLLSAYRHQFPDDMGLVAASVEAQRLALRDALGGRVRFG